MSDFNCTLAKSLSPEEKKVLGQNLHRQGVGENIFLVYENLVDRLSEELQLLCVKAYAGGEIAGAAFFMRVQPVDMLASISALGENAVVRSLLAPFTARNKACAYLCMRSTSTANIMSPFFVRETASADRVAGAILSYLKRDTGAELLMIMDSPLRNGLYASAGFCGYPCPSEAVLELTQYRSLADYLAEHRSTKKHIAPKKNIAVSVQSDGLTPADMVGISACIRDSARHAKSKLPYGDKFMQQTLESDMFRSRHYRHVIVRVDGAIAGFHSYLPCGSSLGAIVGGFNREASQKNYVYERLIAATVDYALQHGLERIHYGIVDNQTKLRLTNTLEPNRAYYYLASPVERRVMRLLNKHTDVYKLFALEESLKSAGSEH